MDGREQSQDVPGIPSQLGTRDFMLTDGKEQSQDVSGIPTQLGTSLNWDCALTD